MSEEQVKFLITAIALSLGVFFYFGWVGWWGIILAILISMLGLFAWRMHNLRNRKKQEEQVQIALSMALLKNFENQKAQNQTNPQAPNS